MGDAELDIWRRLIEGNALHLARALMEHGTLILMPDREKQGDEELLGIAWEPLQTSLCSH